MTALGVDVPIHFLVMVFVVVSAVVGGERCCGDVTNLFPTHNMLLMLLLHASLRHARRAVAY